MSYCHNCGTTVSNDDRFCDHCGVPLEQEFVHGKEVSFPGERGYLFTNIEALAVKLQIAESYVESAIQGFINAKRETGVAYELINASCYYPKLSENSNRGKSIKLSPIESWQTHQRVLIDSYVHDTRAGKEPHYLFIVGGHDIIPMPEISNYVENSDLKVDTDLPYSYLYGSKTLPMMEDCTVFTNEQMLITGRLPLPEEATFAMLSGYLKRAADVSKEGIPINMAYAQCDPHWKLVSSKVAAELLEAGLLPTYTISDPSFIHQSLWLTPSVVRDNIQRFFNPEASFYYFNMHGSNFPQASGFFGVGADKKSWEGITPAELASATSCNVVVTEACYGARFIGKKRSESMLLSALFSNTIIYMGSSRIAYGGVDGTRTENCNVSSADVIAFAFMAYFLRGYSAGDAFCMAQREVLVSTEIPNPFSILTAVEFNLFGDPSLSLLGEERYGKVSKVAKNAMVPKGTDMRCQKTEIYTTRNEGSILSMVRGAVNRNVLQIHEIISEYLYSHYNIEPRRLEQVFQLKYAGGKNRYLYRYTSEHGEIYVQTDDKNEIKTVITSKNTCDELYIL